MQPPNIILLHKLLFMYFTENHSSFQKCTVLYLWNIQIVILTILVVRVLILSYRKKFQKFGIFLLKCTVLKSMEKLSITILNRCSVLYQKYNISWLVYLYLNSTVLQNMQKSKYLQFHNKSLLGWRLLNNLYIIISSPGFYDFVEYKKIEVPAIWR